MRVLLLLLLLPVAATLAQEPVDDPLDAEVDRLVSAMGDSEFAVRKKAYRELKALGPRSVESLGKHVDHPDPEIARRVRQIVESYRREQQGALLSPLGTQDNDFEDSEAMARIVAKGRAILPALYEVLDEEDEHYPRYSYWRMRNTYTAIGALAGDKDLETLLLRLDHGNLQHRNLLRPILEKLDRKKVLARIRELLSDPEANGMIRANLLEMCRGSSLARKESWLAPLARALIEDPSPEVRVAAVRWFALGRDDEMLPKILARAGDEDERVRTEAIRALRIYRTPAAAKALRAALKDPEGNVRAAAIETLRLVSGPEVAPEIRPYLKDPDPFVRSHAARAIGAMKDQASLPILLELLTNRDEEFLTYALHAVVDALRSIGNPAALDPLLALLADAENYRRIETYRYHILSAIVAVGGEKVLPKIQAHLEDPGLQNGYLVLDEIAKLKTDAALPFLMHALENGDTRYRTSAVRGIGARRHAAAAPLIVKAMGEEEDTWFLSEALRAVTAFGYDPGEEVVAKMLAVDPGEARNINLIYTATRAAVRFQMKGLAPRIATILDEYPDRYAYRAVDALGRLGDPKAIPVLARQFAKEKYTSTKYRIALALARLGRGEEISKNLEASKDADDPPTLATRAEVLQALGRADEARAVIRRAIEAGPDSNTRYNLGCILSLLGDKTEALAQVDESMEGKVIYKRNLDMDADLDPIRDDPRFAAIYEKAK
jgi:HEAT repeat protein